MFGSSQEEKKKEKRKTIQGQEETVASTEGQTPRPYAALSYGGLYIPLCGPHTPDPMSKSKLRPLQSFLGYALENRADEREYDAEGDRLGDRDWIPLL